MVTSFLEVPLHFTVEFLGFLVCAGGAILIAARRTLVQGAFNRMTAAAGLGALAAAQLMHGAAFLELDAAEVLVGIRTVGYGLVLLAIVGSFRGEPVALAFAGLERPSVMAPAGAAALLALMAGLAAFREKTPGFARLALAAFFLAAGEAVIGFSPAGSFLQGTVDDWTYASHGLRLAGFAALGSWLWMSVRSSIRLRFVVSFAALLVIVVLALSSALSAVISSTVEQSELERVRAELRVVSVDISREAVGDVRGDVARVAGSDQVRTSLAGRDRPALQSLAAGFKNLFSMDFVIFMRSDRRVLAQAASGPVVTEDGRPVRMRLRAIDLLKIPGSRVVHDVAEGSPLAASLDNIGTDLVAVMAASRVNHPALPGRIAGVVAAGRFVDAAQLDDLSGPSFFASLLSGERVVASDLQIQIDPDLLIPPDVRNQVVRGQTITREQVLDARPFFTAFGRLESPGGVPVGILAVSSNADLVTSTREGVTRTLFIVAMAVGALVLLLAWLSGRRITRPIQSLTDTVRAVREGDLTAKAAVVGDDEVGQLGETFNDMTTSLARMTRDLRQAAREEHSLRARIETILESMADGLVAVDTDRKILAFNRQLETLTGIPSSQAIASDVERIIDVRDAQGERIPLPIFQLSEGSITGAFLVNRRGDRVPVAVTSAVLRNEEDEPAGGVAIVRDITNEHQVERMKSEFLSNISHELRTPLTPIKGYAEILGRRNVPPAKIKQFVEGILASTARLERIVELLVDFAAMEAGRLAPRATPVALGPMIQHLADLWGERSSRHQVIAEVDRKLPPVLGDERLLRRSVEEMLDNAVKFSPDGGTIRVEARAATVGNARRKRKIVEVVVTDEGIGIPPEDLRDIFSDFRQLDGSATRTYGGLGLGLAFVRRIVEQHDGEVAVESEPDRGTSFKITIPAAGTRQVPEEAAVPGK